MKIFQCGNYTDATIFRNCMKTMLLPIECVFAVRGYKYDCCGSITNDEPSETSLFSKNFAQQECVNRRLKQSNAVV